MSFFRPTFCEVNLSALRHNYLALKEKSQGRAMLPVIKANAYGHGAAKVAQALEKEQPSFFGVATIEEGIELRKSGLLTPILCLGGLLGASAQEFIEYKLTPVLFNKEGILKLAEQVTSLSKKENCSLPFHLKIDTGMGRLGVFPQDLKELLETIRYHPQISLQGVLTHLARAEETDSTFKEQQLKEFNEVENKIKSQGFDCPIFHMANSAALIDGDLKNTNLVRPGVALYGAYPHPRLKDKIDLKPVLQWKTQIISIKKFPKNTPISYGGTFVTQRASTIAVIAVGYADGYSRLFSNCGEVLVRNQRAPVVGRVCMDLTMIDVTGLLDVKLGDEVVLLGSQGNEQITAEEMAQKIGTISYEIFCNISARVPKIYTYPK